MTVLTGTPPSGRMADGMDREARNPGCPLRGQAACSLTLLMEERGLDRLENLSPEEMQTCALCLLGRLAG